MQKRKIGTRLQGEEGISYHGFVAEAVNVGVVSDGHGLVRRFGDLAVYALVDPVQRKEHTFSIRADKKTDSIQRRIGSGEIVTTVACEHFLRDQMRCREHTSIHVVVDLAKELVHSDEAVATDHALDTHAVVFPVLGLQVLKQL